MHVTADRDRCCGSGNCAFVAPEVFTQDDVDGRVLLQIADLDPALAEQVLQAADECPVAAIEVT